MYTSVNINIIVLVHVFLNIYIVLKINNTQKSIKLI